MDEVGLFFRPHYSTTVYLFKSASINTLKTFFKAFRVSVCLGHDLPVWFAQTLIFHGLRLLLACTSIFNLHSVSNTIKCVKKLYKDTREICEGSYRLKRLLKLLFIKAIHTLFENKE